MDKFRRNDRMSVIFKTLCDAPNKIFTYSYFCEKFSTAKSTISEDIDLLQSVAKRFHMGEIQTVTGASGGVRWRCTVSPEQALHCISDLCEKLAGTDRTLPGGFLYNSDLLSDPVTVQQMGEIIASEFYDTNPDFVLTMETKGIPVALATAKAMGIPLVIARHSSKVYEGSAVNINYVSGSSNTIETMSLSRRAVKEGQRALIVDDFLKGGGTAKGMVDLMSEFNVQVVGQSFVLENMKPARKRISGHKSLMLLDIVPDGDGEKAIVTPSAWLRRRVNNT